MSKLIDNAVFDGKNWISFFPFPYFFGCCRFALLGTQKSFKRKIWLRFLFRRIFSVLITNFPILGNKSKMQFEKASWTQDNGTEMRLSSVRNCLVQDLLFLSFSFPIFSPEWSCVRKLFSCIKRKSCGASGPWCIADSKPHYTRQVKADVSLSIFWSRHVAPCNKWGYTGKVWLTLFLRPWGASF